MLFKRLHLQFTGLCALITAAILALFTILYLSVAEHTMKENLTLSCRNRYDTLGESMEQQTVLTYRYLLSMEQNNECMIFLWDNGIPLSFNRLETHASYHDIADMLYEDYLAKTTAQPAESTLLSDGGPQWIDPGIAGQFPQNLYAGICNITTNRMNSSQKAYALKNNQGLVLLAIFPNDSLRHRLLQQRVLFGLLSLAGCLLLTLFSYLFTGYLLKPLRENQENQLAFIAGASHELRTPLAVILSAVTAKPPHYTETIKTETLRMGRLVDELLFLSRADETTEKCRASFQFTSVEPDTFLLDFYEQMEPYVLSKGRSLSLQLSEESLPVIQADRDKLRQLFEILLQNALAYTNTDGHIQLALSFDPGKKQICMEVSDDGIGIPDAEKEKIFDRFYRIENAHSDKEHFGLGLCIATKIMEEHKGKITVKDRPGGGSIFCCSFPAKTVSR